MLLLFQFALGLVLQLSPGFAVVVEVGDAACEDYDDSEGCGGYCYCCFDHKCGQLDLSAAAVDCCETEMIVDADDLGV